jgi:hypothetical protein
MRASDMSLGERLLAMTVLFVWVMAIWVYIVVLCEILRRQDHRGRLPLIFIVAVQGWS